MFCKEKRLETVNAHCERRSEIWYTKKGLKYESESLSFNNQTHAYRRTCVKVIICRHVVRRRNLEICGRLELTNQVICQFILSRAYFTGSLEINPPGNKIIFSIF